MAAILPDDIRDISSMQLPQQIDTIQKYIKYMKEQIEFWGSNRDKSMSGIEGLIAALTDGLNTLADAMNTILDTTIPEIQGDVSDLENAVGAIQDTTIPAIQDDISDLDTAVNTLLTLSIYRTDGTKIWPPS